MTNSFSKDLFTPTIPTYLVMAFLAAQFVSNYIYNENVRITYHNGFIYYILRGDVLEFNNSEKRRQRRWQIQFPMT